MPYTSISTAPVFPPLLSTASNLSRVAVRLIGNAPNTAAVGSKIHVLGGPVPDQEREVTVGGLYLSSSDALQTFATGEATVVDIVVEWRGGGRTQIPGATPNRLYEIRESGAQAGTATDSTERADPPSALFEDVSELLGHSHRDTRFDDYRRQPLLPHQLSQLGPGVTWYDVDRDGDEDLLITSGRGGRLAYLRNDGNRFSRTRLAADPATLDQTTVLAIPNQIGGTSLVVGQSSHEAASPEAAVEAAAVLGLDPAAPSTEPAMVVPGGQGSTGPLAMADYDGNGELDLFVGGRSVPAAYPVPAPSRLYRRQDGEFVLDEVNAQLLAGIGLVSSAVFTDIDGDGDSDLVLAVDWGPVKLLINSGGQYTEETDAWGLTAFTSRWNGIASGDLNGDGLPDLVATSWGRNTQYRLAGRPLISIFGDFDGDGPFDVLEATFDERLDGYAPVPDRTVAALGLPLLSTRVPTHAAYADATVEEIVGQRAGPTFRYQARNLDHMVFLNRGSGFDARPLPLEAQFAPASYVGITDFDGDGNEDVFLSQNFFPTGPLTPPLDGGRGLLLLGDGTGELMPVPGQESGIAVYGDQRGAGFADYDRDGRMDLVVSQHAAETKLYHNVGAEPGVRVRLLGPPSNPHGVGASIRGIYGDRRGPVREVQAGSGYWSSNGAVLVFGRADDLTSVWVRWPGGVEIEVMVDGSDLEVTVPFPN